MYWWKRVFGSFHNNILIHNAVIKIRIAIIFCVRNLLITEEKKNVEENARASAFNAEMRNKCGFLCNAHVCMRNVWTMNGHWAIYYATTHLYRYLFLNEYENVRETREKIGVNWPFFHHHIFFFSSLSPFLHSIRSRTAHMFALYCYFNFANRFSNWIATGEKQKHDIAERWRQLRIRIFSCFTFFFCVAHSVASCCVLGDSGWVLPYAPFMPYQMAVFIVDFFFLYRLILVYTYNNMCVIVIQRSHSTPCASDACAPVLYYNAGLFRKFIPFGIQSNMGLNAHNIYRERVRSHSMHNNERNCIKYLSDCLVCIFSSFFFSLLFVLFRLIFIRRRNSSGISHFFFFHSLSFYISNTLIVVCCFLGKQLDISRCSSYLFVALNSISNECIPFFSSIVGGLVGLRECVGH